MSAIILFRSLTFAQRGSRLLEAGGVPSTIIKAPQSLTRHGCAYGVSLSDKKLNRALEILQSRNVDHGRIYYIDNSGEYREAGL